MNVGGADMLGFLYAVLEGYIEPTPEAIGAFIAGLSTNLSLILWEINALNQGMPVLLFNIYEPYPLAFILEPGEYSSLLPLLAGVNAAIAGFAVSPDVYFVDAYAAFNDYPGSELEKAALLFVDAVHPSALGQELLVEAAYDVLGNAGLLDSKPISLGLAK